MALWHMSSCLSWRNNMEKETKMNYVVMYCYFAFQITQAQPDIITKTHRLLGPWDGQNR